MGHYYAAPFPLIVVREPNDDDVLKGLVAEDTFNGDFQNKDGRTVYAVVQIGNHCTLYLDGYVDWYGDGGTTPQEVAEDFVGKLVGMAYK